MPLGSNSTRTQKGKKKEGGGGEGGETPTTQGHSHNLERGKTWGTQITAHTRLQSKTGIASRLYTQTKRRQQPHQRNSIFAPHFIAGGTMEVSL